MSMVASFLEAASELLSLSFYRYQTEFVSCYSGGDSGEMASGESLNKSLAAVEPSASTDKNYSIRKSG